VSIPLEEKRQVHYGSLLSQKLVNPPTFRILQNSGAIFLGFIGILAVTTNDLVAQEPAPAPAQPAQPPAQAPAQAPSASATPAPPKAPPADWEPRQAGEISMTAPFPFEDGPDVLLKAPEKVRDTLVSVKTYKAGGPKWGFQVSVTALIYKPGVPVDIDKAIKDMTDKMTAFLGAQDHRFIISPSKVSGVEARQSQFHGTARNGRPAYAAMVVMQQGEKLWEVQTLSVNEAVVQDLARVMASISIETAP
jgi:hypothetical protein